MMPLEATTRRTPSSAQTAGRLEDLIPIAVAVAVGCERCAERTVQQALGRGTPRRAIAYTLGVVTHMRSLDCFAEAVPAEILARMEGPLQAGRKALAGARAVRVEAECCG
jgi:AhpD family alkylhydroperoxidase